MWSGVYSQSRCRIPQAPSKAFLKPSIPIPPSYISSVFICSCSWRQADVTDNIFLPGSVSNENPKSLCQYSAVCLSEFCVFKEAFWRELVFVCVNVCVLNAFATARANML